MIEDHWKRAGESRDSRDSVLSVRHNDDDDNDDSKIQQHSVTKNKISLRVHLFLDRNISIFCSFSDFNRCCQKGSIFKWINAILPRENVGGYTTWSLSRCITRISLFTPRMRVRTHPISVFMFLWLRKRLRTYIPSMLKNVWRYFGKTDFESKELALDVKTAISSSHIWNNLLGKNTYAQRPISIFVGQLILTYWSVWVLRI